MAIAFNHLTSGADGNGGTTSTTASVAPTANALVLAVIVNGDGGSAVAPPDSLSGNGLTWVLVDNQTISSTKVDVSVWRALGASPSAGAITVNQPAGIDHCLWHVCEFTGVDTSGTNGSGAVPATNIAKNTGTGTNPSLTLPNALSAGSASFGAVVVNGNDAITEGAGYTEVYATDQYDSSPGALLNAEYDLTGTTTVNWTIDGANRKAYVGFEIKAAAGGGSVTFAGVTAGAATLSGAVVRAVKIAGVTVGAATASGALAKVSGLRGAATGATTAAGAINRAAGLQGAAASLSTAIGALGASRALGGQAAGVSGASGSTFNFLVLLSGSSGAASALAGALSRSAGLSGSAAGLSGASAQLVVVRSFAGVTAGVSTASAPALYMLVFLEGAAAGSSSAMGSLGVLVLLSGAASGLSVVTAELVIVEGRNPRFGHRRFRTTASR